MDCPQVKKRDKEKIQIYDVGNKNNQSFVGEEIRNVDNLPMFTQLIRGGTWIQLGIQE